jgi:putative DNA primase/helicase
MTRTLERPGHYAPFFAGLKRLQERDWGWEACCPAHEDANPSLSVRLGRDGQLVIKCHAAGCPPEAIVEALGLQMTDLFPPLLSRAGERRLKFVEAYDYRDEGRKVLFQVVRWVDDAGKKTFSQRRPNPAFQANRPRDGDNPEWLRGVDGCRRLLYRLPEMREALSVDGRRAVFLLEGEKAVDYCRGKGLVATCNPMGASKGKWCHDYAEQLRGTNVLIVPDEDEPDPETGACTGLDHAEAAAWSLYGVANTVKVVRLLPALKNHQGLDDCLAGQKDVGAKEAVLKLRALCNKTALWRPLPDCVPEEMCLLAAELRRLREGAAPEGDYGLLGLVRSRGSLLESALTMKLERPGNDDAGRIRRAALRAAAAALLAGGMQP